MVLRSPKHDIITMWLTEEFIRKANAEDIKTKLIELVDIARIRVSEKGFEVVGNGEVHMTFRAETKERIA